MSEAMQQTNAVDDLDDLPSRMVATAGSFTQRRIEGRDGVSLYLEEVAQTPLLDAEQEVELSKTIEAGLIARKILEGEADNIPGVSVEELEWLAEEGDRAKTHFLKANLRLVVSIARKYSSQMPILDLIQEGNTGLVRAVEKFDYTQGFKFSTYATWWVRQAVTRGIAQQAKLVRLPVYVFEQMNQVVSVRRTLERQLGYEPTPDDIAAELDIDVERVVDLIAWARDHVSLDAPVDDDGNTSLGDLIGQEATVGPDVGILDQESLSQLNTLIDQLDDRAANIIRRRFGLHDGRQHKLADIGALHCISAERVRQLEREALVTLRRLSAMNSEDFLAYVSSREEQAQPKQKPLGIRAQQRKELQDLLDTRSHDLSEQEISILMAYITSSSLDSAASKFNISGATFSKRLNLAKAALFLAASDDDNGRGI